MPRPIRIVTDTSSDISAEEAEALGIDLVPLSVTIGNRTYPEDALTRDAYFDLARGQVVRTSQPPTGVFYTVFERWVARGYQVLCVTLSSLLSGTYQSACQAAQALAPHVTVYDSLGISRFHAAQVLFGHKCLTDGGDLPTIIETMRAVRDRSHMLFQLDTLERLRQGGRAAALMHIFDRFARAFQIKPIITMAGGELKFAHVSRTFRRGMAYMLHELSLHQPAEHVAVVHTRQPELAEQYATALCAAVGFNRSQAAVCEVGAVLASHGGEKLLGAMVVSAP